MQIKYLIIRFISIFIIPKNLRKVFRKKYLPAKKISFIKNNSFFTFDEKPITSKQYNALSDIIDKKQRSKVAVVLQGPIKKEFDFTEETIKIYLKTFEGCKIILSTWNSEDDHLCDKIRNLGVEVVKSKAPEPSWLNMNHQIVSTRAGLQVAKDLGCEFVFKTRTDQRMYETNIVEYLLNMLKVFPLETNVSQQKYRLITTSFNTFKFRLYEPSDMFLFGHIDDVMNYWSCPFVERARNIEISHKLLEFCKQEPAEIYFFTNFLKRTGWNLEWTLSDSWLAYAERLCIIDTVSIGLYWPKYSNLVNRFRNFFGKNNVLEELTFKEWLDLYINKNNKFYVPEYYIKNADISKDIIKTGKLLSFILDKKNILCFSPIDFSKYTLKNTVCSGTDILLTDDTFYSKEQIKSLLDENVNITIIYLTNNCIDIKNRRLFVINPKEFSCYDLACLRLL